MSGSGDFSRFSGNDAVRSSLKEKSIVGAMIAGGGGILDFLLRLVSILVLARLLVPEYFGLVAMVAAVTGILEQFSSLGLSTAAIQAPKLTHQQASNLFWINAAAGLVFALLVAALAPFIAAFYRDSRLEAITLILAITFFVSGLSVQHLALLNRQMKQPQIVGNRLVASAIGTCTSVALALSGYEYWALVWRDVIAGILVVVGSWVLCPWFPSMPRRNANTAGLIRFGVDMTLTTLLVGVISRLDSLLIGRISGASVLGAYRQAYNLMMAPIEQLNGPIHLVSQPGLSMLRMEGERYRRYYLRILLVVTTVAVPLGVYAAVYAEDIITVVLGANWKDAVIFLQIFGVAAAIRPAVATTGLVLITSGRSRMYLYLALVHSAALVALMGLGSVWGAVGVAVAHVGATVLLLPWKLYYSFTGSPVKVGDFVRCVSRPVVGGVGMAGVLLILRAHGGLDPGFTSLMVGGTVGALTYLATFFFLPGGRGEIGALAAEVRDALLQRCRG